jgi:hypothetical protein
MGRKFTKFIDKAKLTLKHLLLTKEGWLSWLIANVITSLPWIISFAIGFLFDNHRWYVIGGSIWTFIMLPITPFWILNIIIAVFIMFIKDKLNFLILIYLFILFLFRY